MIDVNIEMHGMDTKDLKVTTSDGYDLTKLGINNLYFDCDVNDIPRATVEFLAPNFTFKGNGRFDWDLTDVPIEILKELENQIRAERMERDE